MNTKTKNFSKLIVLGIIISFFITPIFVFAQCSDGTTSCLDGSASATTNNPSTQTNTSNSNTSAKITITNPFKQNTIKGLIETIVKDILVPIGAVVAVLMIMYAGFLYVTAKGDPGQIKRAHDALLWAVVGAAILLGAWVISEAISTTVDQLRK